MGLVVCWLLKLETAVTMILESFYMSGDLTVKMDGVVME